MQATVQTQAEPNCITINAAFLQEVKEDSCAVWATMHSLREICGIRFPSPEQVHQWVLWLTEFRRLLSTEFALEETYGYIGNAKRQHLFSGFEPDKVLRQHKELYLQLLDLCERVEESQYVGTVVRDFKLYVAAFQEFDAALLHHEVVEARMIRCGLGLT